MTAVIAKAVDAVMDMQQIITMITPIVGIVDDMIQTVIIARDKRAVHDMNFDVGHRQSVGIHPIT